MANFRNLMTIHITGMKRYRIADGGMVNEATIIYTQSQADELNQDESGFLPMKMNAPWALFDACRGCQFPADFQCEVEIRPAAGGKTALFVLSANPVKSSTAIPVASKS